jgi:hypothetical protein
MPKYTEEENKFWSDLLLNWINNRVKKKCNICGRWIHARSKSGRDHFFGKTHPHKNVYEIFSPIPLDSRTLIKDKDGILRPHI